MLDNDRSLIVTDQRGWPKISGIHDARLHKLSVKFGHALSFETIGQNDVHRTFVLDGLCLLRIDGHWDAVIVDTIAIWNVTDAVDERSGEDLSRAWRTILTDRIHAGGEADEVERLRHRHGGLNLMSLTSSYGGEMQALCRELLIDGRRVVAA